MSEKRTLTTRVPESVADEWDKYVNENPDDVNSIAHLLRKGVNAYVAGSDSRTSQPAEVEAEPSGEVLNALERIESKVEEVNDKVGSVERAAYGSGEAVGEIYDALPEGRSNAIETGTLAKVAGKPLTTVIETLETMMDDLDDVHQSPDGGYYKGAR